VVGLDTGLLAYGSTINADNVLVKLDPPGVGGQAFYAEGTGGTPANIDVRHATATGGTATSTGLRVRSGTNPAEVASGSLVSSIVRVPGTALSRQTQGAGPTPAHLAANFNDFDAGASVDIGPGNGPGSQSDLNRTTADPRFLDAAAGDLRLRYDSPVIDAGHAVDLGTGPEDFAGDERVVDGNGDGTARRDMGAYEYQRRAPAAPAVTVAPPSALTGDPIAWSATASDPDGDPVNLTWTWSDGVGSSGPLVSRTFTSPGTYTGTARATDATGLSTSASADATVGARPGTTPPPPPRDVTPPSFSFLSTKARLTAKGTITLRLQCGAGEFCAGKLTLASAKKLGRKRRVLKLGSAEFGINAGRPKNIRLKVPKSAAATVRRLRSLKIVASGVATDTAGNRGTARRKLTLVAARVRR
jgi:hypothetical protein